MHIINTPEIANSYIPKQNTTPEIANSYMPKQNTTQVEHNKTIMNNKHKNQFRSNINNKNNKKKQRLKRKADKEIHKCDDKNNNLKLGIQLIKGGFQNRTDIEVPENIQKFSL